MKKIEISCSTWQKIGSFLFGANRNDWIFVCPNCGRRQSIEIIESSEISFTEIQESFIGQSCIFCKHSHFRNENPIKVIIGERVSIQLMDFEPSISILMIKYVMDNENRIIINA